MSAALNSCEMSENPSKHFVADESACPNHTETGLTSKVCFADIPLDLVHLIAKYWRSMVNNIHTTAMLYHRNIDPDDEEDSQERSRELDLESEENSKKFDRSQYQQEHENDSQVFECYKEEDRVYFIPTRLKKLTLQDFLPPSQRGVAPRRR